MANFQPVREAGVSEETHRPFYGRPTPIRRIPIDGVPSKEYTVQLNGEHYGDFDTAYEILEVWQTGFVVFRNGSGFQSKTDLEKLAQQNR